MFKHVKEGDRVTRMVGGMVPMSLVVEEVTDTLIKCGGGWWFDRHTGAEIDEYLGWGNEKTGSYLVVGEKTNDQSKHGDGSPTG